MWYRATARYSSRAIRPKPSTAPTTPASALVISRRAFSECWIIYAPHARPMTVPLVAALHRREIDFEQLSAAHDGDQRGGRYELLPGPLSSQGAPNRISERSDDTDWRQRQYQPRRCGDTPRIVRRRGVWSGMGQPPLNQVCA